MPLVTITFPNPLNVSVQVGDIAWFVPSVDTTTLPSTTANSSLTEIGPITTVGIDFIIVDVNAALWASGLLGTDDFIMFAKDNQANMSSLLGYFARFRFENDSYDTSELFSITADYFESSK